MSYTSFDVPGLAAILLSRNTQLWHLEEYDIAYNLIAAEALLEQHIRMNEWNSAAHRAQFKSSWLHNGEPYEIQF